ncbi:MAG: glycosyltransferase [Ignavibacteria bacterium]|jgi:glycosyltransferase involved in cell wall biosynthesis|nr:glycosyltransferase [Ignavibacteria bacterium]
MKVVHICATDAGGAGKAAYRLHKGLVLNGVDSCLLVAGKTTRDDSVKVIPEINPSVPGYCLNPDVYRSEKMMQQWNKWFTKMSSYSGRDPGLEIFTDVSSVDVDFGMLMEVREADIVNFHWMSGLLNFNKISSQFRDKNIVWTLHDMNPITGGCHYAEECRNFHYECGKCPQIASGNPKDDSNENWKSKLNAYRKMNISFVTPSNWLRNEALKSSLAGNNSVSVIANGFPMDVFRNYDKKVLRKAAGISENSKVILFGVDSFTTRKGFSFLRDALELLAEKVKDNVTLLIFGNIPDGIKLPEAFTVLNAGRITDEKALAGVYNIADVLVIPSLDDNLPNVVPESLACGTPVVGFNSGGIPDMIEHKRNGYLAERKNYHDLAEGIYWVLFEADAEFLKTESLRIARDRFAAEKQAKEYMMLYEKILERKVQNSKSYSKSEKKKNKGSNVLVSAVVSVFNSEKFIRGCLDDLLGQTLYEKGELEIVLVNTGSEENEDAIIREYKSKHPDIKYIKTDERETIYQAWNRGVKASSGKFITNANTDDRHRRDALEVLSGHLDRNEDVDLVYSDLYVTKIENETFESRTVAGKLERPPYNPEHFFIACLMGPQPMWRKSVHEKIGYFDESLMSAADYEFWCRMAFVNNSKMLHIPEFLGLYYYNQNGIEMGNRPLSEKESDIIRNKYKMLLNDNKTQYNSSFKNLSKTKSKIGNVMNSFNEAPGRNSEIILAESLIESDRLNEAVDILMHLMQTDPGNVDAMNDLAVISIMAGDYEAAADFIERVIRIDPMNDVALDNMNCLSSLIDEKMAQLKNDSFQNTAEGFENYQTGNETQKPKGPYGDMIEKAEAFIESEDLTSARKVLETILLMEEGNLDALNDLSVIEIMEKNYQAAAELLERVIRKEPDNEVATENLLILQRELDKL